MKETNMEHYRGEIERIIYSESCEFAPAIVAGKPVPCAEGRVCKECQFRAETTQEECSISFIKWLMSEYKPEPVLTAREKHFVEFAETGWLARDRGGSLYQHRGKPYKKDEREWSSTEGFLNISYFDVDALFPFITWEDEEPWSVEELRELKVEE